MSTWVFSPPSRDHRDYVRAAQALDGLPDAQAWNRGSAGAVSAALAGYGDVRVLWSSVLTARRPSMCTSSARAARHRDRPGGPRHLALPRCAVVGRGARLLRCAAAAVDVGRGHRARVCSPPGRAGELRGCVGRRPACARAGTCARRRSSPPTPGACRVPSPATGRPAWVAPALSAGPLVRRSASRGRARRSPFDRPRDRVLRVRCVVVSVCVACASVLACSPSRVCVSACDTGALELRNVVLPVGKKITVSLIVYIHQSCLYMIDWKGSWTFCRQMPICGVPIHDFNGVGRGTHKTGWQIDGDIAPPLKKRA
eukprot:3183103-Prymnesium_polylepis.1